MIGLAVIGLDLYLGRASNTAAQDQTSTAILMSITGLWVLVALARPFSRASLAIVVAMYAFMVATFAVPAVAQFFGFASLAPQQWLVPVVLGVLVCAGLETVNRVVATRALAR